MSRIYFHAEDGDAEVRGSERAYMAALVRAATAGVLGIASDDRLRELLPREFRSDRSDDARPGSAIYLAHELDLFLHGFSGSRFTDGEDVFSVVLNTALVVGGDALRLAARLHGQCEIHAWVDGPDRPWLADMIRGALTARIFRQAAGWDGVVEFLGSGAGPVVTSYSVCESFPNPDVANWEPPTGDDEEPDWDAWYDLDDAERWRLGMEGLRAAEETPSGRLRLQPSGWGDFHFGSGRTAFDYLASPSASTGEEKD